VRAEEDRKGCKYPSWVAYKISSIHASCLSGVLFLNSVEPLEFILFGWLLYCVRLCEASKLDGRRLNRLSFKCHIPTTSVGSHIVLCTTSSFFQTWN